VAFLFCRKNEEGFEQIQCGADEHRRRGLDRAAPRLNRIPHPLPQKKSLLSTEKGDFF
jgi:hypothetical protein